jgi:hypothetical protein
MTMWCRKLRDDGTIPDLQDPKPRIRHGHVPRGERHELPLRMTQGEEWKTGWKLQKFNYDTNVAEPIDLTGHHLTFRIFGKPPPRTVTVLTLARNDGSGDAIEVPLTEEQNAQLALLQPEQQPRFIQHLLEGMPEVVAKLSATTRQGDGDAPPPATGRAGDSRASKTGGAPPEDRTE